MARLHLSAPCDAPWEGMTQVAGGRHCASCDKVVRDLTRATEVEAAATALLFGGAGLCARLRVDGAGLGVFASRRHADTRRPGVALALATLGVAACAPTPAAPCPAEPRAELVAIPAPSAGPSARGSALGQVAGGGALDRDGDGITDADDRCPADPAAESADGCPTRHIVITSGGAITILKYVHFAPNAASIDQEDAPVLDAIAELLSNTPQLTRVIVEGHTDTTEPAADKLSTRRAQAVIAYLVGKGIDRQRLVADPLGHRRPIADDTTPEGREKNRSVRFRLEP